MPVGDKVMLDAVRPDDTAMMFEWINDPDTVRFNAPYRPVSWESHLAWMRALEQRGDAVIFAVRTLDPQRLVGTLQLVDIHPIHRSAELRIRLGDPSARGKGYGTEAVRLALSHAWNDLGLHRIGAHVFAGNDAALRAYRKAGFRSEGRLRQAAFIGGRWLDIVVMGALNPLARSR